MQTVLLRSLSVEQGDERSRACLSENNGRGGEIDAAGKRVGEREQRP